MQDNTGKVVLGLLGMVAVWIGVYWWWPVDPPVSFAQTQPVMNPRGPVDAGHTPTPAPNGAGTPSATLAQQPIREPVVEQPPPPRQAGVIAPVFIQHTIGVGETLESIS